MSDRLFDPARVHPDDGTAPHTPGQELQDHRGWKFMFVKASAASISAHHTCVIQNNGQTARHTTTANADVGRPCGIPFFAIPRNHFGWLCIWGAGQINVAASCSADAHLYTTSTGGRLDDASASQSRIQNIGLTSNRSGTAGLASAVWCYPVCD